MYKEKEIEKIFYSTGDVAKIMKVNVSKVRFWEKEFNIINPNRNAAGKRKFTKQDIEKIKLIDQLLNENKLNNENQFEHSLEFQLQIYYLCR